MTRGFESASGFSQEEKPEVPVEGVKEGGLAYSMTPMWEVGLSAKEGGEEEGDAQGEFEKGPEEGKESTIEFGSEEPFDHEFVDAVEKSRDVMEPMLLEIARREGIPLDPKEIERVANEVRERGLKEIDFENTEGFSQENGGVLRDMGAFVENFKKNHPRMFTALGAVLLSFTLMRGLTSEAEAGNSRRSTQDIMRVIVPVERGVVNEMDHQFRSSELMQERNNLVARGNAIFANIQHLESEAQAMERARDDRGAGYRRIASELRKEQGELRRIDARLTQIEKRMNHEAMRANRARAGTVIGVLNGVLWSASRR